MDGFSRGLAEQALLAAKGGTFSHGVSVGCGNGGKEMALMDLGLVERFTLFELSPKRMELGLELARKKGLENRVEFWNQDAFSADLPEGGVDFVHWNNALHHMMNVDAAVAWSRRLLRDGGMFYMDDFVGPARFQWSDKALALCSSVRAALPEKYLANPKRADGREPTELRRPSRVALIKDDPSEAADSDRIFQAVHRHFPDAWIRRTGGVVYHCALAHCIQNFDPGDPADTALLDMLLLMDDMALDIPGIECHYAVALAFKDASISLPQRASPPSASRRSWWHRVARRVLNQMPG
jgi:SAM-dependent methyltransferase